MARTPDRSPGAMIEDEEIRFISNSNGPTVPGAFNYNGTEFVMRDAAGTFNPRSSAGAFTMSGTRVETAFTASFPSGLSGSLTQLADGTPYLIAGSNVTITSESNGAVTISSAGAGGGAGGDTYWSSSQGGTVFSTGSVSAGGFITASLGFSGSLTRLVDGTSYLIAGENITITSESNGSIEISASASSTQSIVINGTAIANTATVVGTIYIPSARVLSAASAAFMGGSLVGDVSLLELISVAGGSALATWQKTGVLGSQALTSGGTISSAGWYDLVLQGTSGSGVAFCKGLYLI